jgi:outer membrane biogenesis lipoprotein LolB
MMNEKFRLSIGAAVLLVACALVKHRQTGVRAWLQRHLAGISTG